MLNMNINVQGNLEKYIIHSKHLIRKCICFVKIQLTTCFDF